MPGLITYQWRPFSVMMGKDTTDCISRRKAIAAGDYLNVVQLLNTLCGVYEERSPGDTA